MVNYSYGISQDEMSFLHACLYGQVYRIEKLIDKVNINVQDEEEGYTPLMNAIRGRKMEAVKILLEHNADVTKIKDNSGRNAFFWAAALDELEMLKLFEKYNPDFNTVDNEGITTLMFSVQTDKVNIIDICLSQKKDLNIKDTEGKTALFHTISSFGILENVKTMTENMFGDYAKTDYVKNYMSQKKIEDTDTAIDL